MTTPEEKRLKMEHEAALETLLAVQKECMHLERENAALRKEMDEWRDMGLRDAISAAMEAEQENAE
jgi:hypothetical protein